MEIISLLLLGVIAGILAGLLGVGGGIVIVPILVLIFHTHAEIPTTIIMHMAVATSLATIVVTSISSTISHQRHGAILWPLMWQLTPGIIIGSLLGAKVADILPGDVLRILFGIFVLCIVVQFGLGVQPSPHRRPPGWLGMGTMGFSIGMLSTLVGIGGGSLTVPFLVWCNISIRNVVATSAACGLPIALAGTLGFIVVGQDVKGLPPWSVGYVYLPAFITIVPMSLLFAPLGARLAHTVRVNVLKKMFAVFLLMVGIKMLWKELSYLAGLII